MPVPCLSPLVVWLERWLASAAARGWAGHQTAAMAWMALVLRTGAILAECKKRQLRHSETAAAALAFVRRPTLPRWQRLLCLHEPHPGVQQLAAALQDTEDAAILLAHPPADLWLGLAAALPQHSALPEMEALYLTVLRQHASAARQTFGQFYTPAPLVEKMWQLGWAQWQNLGARPALVLDPSCGSGAFLRHPAAAPAWPDTTLLRRGFEVQPLPRTLARLHALDAPHTAVLAADALTHSETIAGPRFVIGNPPWRNPSPALRNPTLKHFLRHDLMPYAWHYEGIALASMRGCTHGMREDSVFFLGRALEWLLPRGVAVLVTSDSWLDAPTYTLLRRYLLDTTRVHSVLRLGRYFPGVQERAAVVVLSRGYAPTGRQQVIDHADWSAKTPGPVESQWETPATPMQVAGDTCQLRPAHAAAGRGRRQQRVALHALFARSTAGAQSGCSPLFLAPDRSTVEERMERLFALELKELAEELGPQVRGGAAQAHTLLLRVAAARKAHGVRPLGRALRPIWAHFRGPRGVPARKQGWCYFDPRLWLFPRVPRQAAARHCFWDIEPKLVYRDVYDPHDKPIAGVVDTAGWVCDNHVFNGGTRVAAVRAIDGTEALTPVGQRVRQWFESDMAFLSALARCLNAPHTQRWGHEHPREPLTVELERLRDEG